MDRRYYIMIGTIAAIFCLGSVFLGVDAQSVGRRAALRQKQESMALNEQLKEEAAPKTADEVVSAEY